MFAKEKESSLLDSVLENGQKNTVRESGGGCVNMTMLYSEEESGVKVTSGL